MRTYIVKQLTSLIGFYIVFSGCPLVLSAGTPVITVTGNKISMTNDVGCKLDFFFENGKYGLGTFYFKDVALGEPVRYFLTEDNIWENSANSSQQLWKESWHPYFQADKYEIIHNSADSGIIRFSGRMGKLSGSVTITLFQGSSGYKLDYNIKALETIKHPLYVSGPFIPDKMEFIQFPFETPVVPPFKGHWAITPTLSTIPLMFGCEKIDGKEYYVGVGYQLEKDQYEKGKIQFDAAKTNPFQIYFISKNNSGWLAGGWAMGDGITKLHIVISTAVNQYDCITGYRKMSGYDVSTPIRRSLSESLNTVMDMYKNCSGYVELPPYRSKAYHHQIVPSTGKPPVKGYGAWINIGINVQLAYQFYKYWQTHPSETWARDRAVNMAGFFMEVQNEDGSVPSLWDPKEKKFRTYSNINTDRGYIFTMDRQAVGAYSLYRMYLAKKESEKTAVDEWRKSALKAMDYIVSKIKVGGVLGRNYDKYGKYDMIAGPNEALLALDYFYAQTGDKKYAEALEILEKYTYDNFVRTNHWSDWSSDWGGWDGEGAPPWDTDGLNSLTFATYCVYRHMHTGDQKYIDWARHVVAYNWLINIPVQFPGFKHVTKGLTREQDHYLTYDIPFRTTLFNDCFPYLSLITQDRFFIDFYKMLIQTQHAYQHPADKGFQSFDIGLWWDASGSQPRDEIGEPDINYIVEFCSLYLESVTSPNAYRYVGGPDWGVGLDYDITFTPGSGKDKPYVASASTNVTSAGWDSKTNALAVTLQGEVGSKGVLNINWAVNKESAGNFVVKINGKVSDKNLVKYNSAQNMLMVNYMHKQNVLMIQVTNN
jgi:hypothetical protein